MGLFNTSKQIHVFTQPGLYNVVVKATNINGSSTSNVLQIRVEGQSVYISNTYYMIMPVYVLNQSLLSRSNKMVCAVLCWQPSKWIAVCVDVFLYWLQNYLGKQYVFVNFCTCVTVLWKPSK